MDPTRELNQAIDDGDVERFDRALATVSNLDAADASSWRPLERAIHAGAMGFVERVLKAGADPNAVPTGDDASALERAVTAGRADFVRLLLQHGARPRALRRSHPDPLTTACAMKHGEIVKLLLDAGADANGDDGPNTPLMSAARASCPEVVSLLLARAPDVNLADRDGRTALWWAASASAYDCAPLNIVRIRPGASPAEIAKAMELPPPPTKEELVRHEARILEVVQLLLDAGADPNIQDRTGKPPLGRASCATVAKLLIERGARLDLRDRNKHGIYDWLALTGIPPVTLGLGPRPANEPAEAVRAKRPAKKRPGV